MPTGGYRGRRIEIYFDSEKEKEAVDNAARARGTSASKYILGLVEKDQAQHMAEPDRQIKSLQVRIHALQEEIRQKDEELARIRADNMRERDLAFLSNEGEGSRKFSGQLIQILRDMSPIGDDALLSILGVNAGDSDLQKALGKQLEALESFGLVRRGKNGWCWTE
jgi:hypothetical protein